MGVFFWACKDTTVFFLDSSIIQFLCYYETQDLFFLDKFVLAISLMSSTCMNALQILQLREKLV